jgi:hypothetical protein
LHRTSAVWERQTSRAGQPVGTGVKPAAYRQ